MKVKFLRKVSILACLSFSLVAVGQDKDVHYEATAEEKCRAEVQTIGCGTPTEGNQDSFFACVDGKIHKLGEECREMHKALSSARKDDH